MCFSERISLIAFFVGIFGSSLLYNLGTTNDIIYSLFFAYVSLMQLIDFFLWRNQTCNKTNILISNIGLILNHLQPIVLGLLLLYYKNIPNGELIYFILFVYLLFMIPYSKQYFNDPQCSLKNVENHITWSWNNKKDHILMYCVYLLILLLLCICGFEKNYGLYAAFIALFTIVISIIFYSKNIGSIWCFFTVFLPILTYAARINNMFL